MHAETNMDQFEEQFLSPEDLAQADELVAIALGLTDGEYGSRAREHIKLRSIKPLGIAEGRLAYLDHMDTRTDEQRIDTSKQRNEHTEAINGLLEQLNQNDLEQFFSSYRMALDIAELEGNRA